MDKSFKKGKKEMAAVHNANASSANVSSANASNHPNSATPSVAVTQPRTGVHKRPKLSASLQNGPMNDTDHPPTALSHVPNSPEKPPVIDNVKETSGSEIPVKTFKPRMSEGRQTRSRTSRNQSSLI